MRLLITIVAFIGCTFTSFAQTEVGEIPIKFSKKATVAYFQDQSGYLGIRVDRSGYFDFYLAGPDLELLSTLTVPYSVNARLVYTGAHSLEHRLIYYLRPNYNSGSVNAYVLPKQKGQIGGRISGIQYSEPGTEVISGFTVDDRMWLISLDKKEQIMTVSRFTETKEFENVEFQLDDEMNKEIKSKVAGKKKAFRFIDYRGVLDLPGLNADDKIFVKGDNLYFVTQGYELGKAKVKIVDFDLSAGKYSTKNLSYVSKANYNVYFRYDKLFSFANTNGKVEIRVFGYPDLELIREFEYSSWEEIDIISSDFYTSQKSSLKDGKARFKKLSGGVPVIGVFARENDDIVLRIGSYIIPQSGGGYVPGTPGGSFQTPGGTVTTSGTPGYWTGGGQGAPIIYYFDAVLNGETLEPNPEAEIETMDKKIDDYMRNLEAQGIKVGFAQPLILNANLHLSYYDKKSKSLKIVSLEN